MNANIYILFDVLIFLCKNHPIDNQCFILNSKNDEPYC